ncbi:T9SS type A sorting domain-containing protein [Candidatus Poribacteria bacterium]|nr:T9SS type A sorting domain-containing protein [Candidatus Poribacteria bacterium]
MIAPYSLTVGVYEDDPVSDDELGKQSIDITGSNVDKNFKFDKEFRFYVNLNKEQEFGDGPGQNTEVYAIAELKSVLLIKPITISTKPVDVAMQNDDKYEDNDNSNSPTSLVLRYYSNLIVRDADWYRGDVPKGFNQLDCIVSFRNKESKEGDIDIKLFGSNRQPIKVPVSFANEKDGKVSKKLNANLSGIYYLQVIGVNGAINWYDIKIAFANGGVKASPARDITLVTSDLLPGATALGHNYPNPFNPETWIPYSLAKECDVVIQIYNASGLLIRTLDLGQKAAGFYTSRDNAAYWDGRNESGEPVSSGIYFYRLQVEEFTATRKMLLLK